MKDDIRAVVGRKRGGAKTNGRGRGRRVSDAVTATPSPLRAFLLDGRCFMFDLDETATASHVSRRPRALESQHVVRRNRLSIERGTGGFEATLSPQGAFDTLWSHHYGILQ
jgi:hypothetical protein